MKPHTIRHLRDKEISYNIPFEQIQRIRIRNNDREYIKNLGIHYKQLFEQLIDKYIQKNPIIDNGEILNEILFNLNYMKSNKMREISSDSKEILKKLSDYVIEDRFGNQPLILKGPMGSGKTSHISTFVCNLHMQLEISSTNKDQNHSILVRFIGADQKSIYLRSLLKSVCKQLFYIKTEIHKRHIEPVPDKLTELKDYFKRFLTSEFDLNGGKLIIVFDSLHNLLKNDDSLKLNWLPNYLHPNCKVIISVTNESAELIERLNRKYTNDTSYVETSKLSFEQAKFMIHKYSQSANYRFETPQIESFFGLIDSKSILSLNFKVYLDNMFGFNFDRNRTTTFHEDLSKTINDWIDNLEDKFGKLIVKHILSKFNKRFNVKFHHFLTFKGLNLDYN